MTHDPCIYTPTSLKPEYTFNLRDWGTLVTIFKSHIYPDEADNMRPFVLEARDKLKDFRETQDKLVLAGDPALHVLSIMTLISLDVRRITVLKWDKHLQAYYPITMEV